MGSINGFWMMDNEYFAGEIQYVLTESDIENEYTEYLQIFDGNLSIENFKSEWVYVDADDIQTDEELQHNLTNDIERGVIFDEIICKFINEVFDNMLTNAEQEIIGMLKLEPLASNKQIAQALGKSENTIRNQFSSIYAKFGVNSSRGVDARLKLYFKLGWLKPETSED